MGFVVDKVSEDSFYENLLLGVSKVLDKCPCVSNACLTRRSGARQADIRSWEHNNGVILPEDLRAFYSSTDGFSYTYEFSYDYNGSDENRRQVRVGKIEINPLGELTRAYGYETKHAAQIENRTLTLSRDSKVFELVTVDENAKVVLVYLNAYSAPGVWLYGPNMTFDYLAEDFTTYFRMCVAHLGIPCWQYVVSKEGPPEWSREIFNLVAPGVLPDDRNLVETHKYDLDNLNKIDHNIFSHSQTNIERVSTNVNKPVEKSKAKRAATGTRTKK